MAKKGEVKMNYKKITVKDMVLYIKENDNTEEAKEFINSFYEEKPKKTRNVNLLDDEGKPITYIGKDGKTKIRKKKVAVSKETKQVYNVLKAKKEFYKRYKEVIDFENPPIRTKEKVEVNKIASALALLD